jgi:hypothetical protein
MRLPVKTGRARNGVDVSMSSRVGARAAALVTSLLAVLAGTTAAWPAAARAAREPVWTAAVARHYGASGDASGFSAVTALSRTDAWAFGGTNPGGAGAPVALRWDGQSWRAWPLPPGLHDFIGDASASSSADIWAVSYAGGYVLHWDGSRWLVAKRWRHHQVLTGVTALGPADVWTFGTTASGAPGLGTWHFDGRCWSRPAGIAQDIYRASAVTPDNIWAVAATPQGGFLEHYDGRSWQRAGAGSSALAGLTLDAVLALPGGGVWAAGNTELHGGEGPLVIVHFDGRRWSRTSTSWQADTERLAPDGSGGLWITADDTGVSGGSVVGHLPAAGRLSWLPLDDGAGSGVSDVAAGLGPGPGPAPVWLSGGSLTAAGGDAVIWSRPGGARAETAAEGQSSVSAMRTGKRASASAATVLVRGGG